MKTISNLLQVQFQALDRLYWDMLRDIEAHSYANPVAKTRDLKALQKIFDASGHVLEARWAIADANLDALLEN